jgi:hypothetical protein
MKNIILSSSLVFLVDLMKDKNINLVLQFTLINSTRCYTIFIFGMYNMKVDMHLFLFDQFEK